MFKRFRLLFLALILISYSLLYISTSIADRCDANCERITAVDTLLRKNRDYVYYTSRCNWSPASDSICVWVKDTSGIDWNLLADTVCQIATMNGLLQQKVFILKSTATGFPDTVVKKQCP